MEDNSDFINRTKKTYTQASNDRSTEDIKSDKLKASASQCLISVLP